MPHRTYCSCPTRRQSVSRIAITTGLTRLEVSRLFDTDGGRCRGPVRSTQSRRPAFDRLAPGFGFHGPYGIPYEVPFDGPPGRRSFCELVRRYTGDVPAAEMLDELKRIGVGAGPWKRLLPSPCQLVHPVGCRSSQVPRHVGGLHRPCRRHWIRTCGRTRTTRSLNVVSGRQMASHRLMRSNSTLT